MNDTWNSAEDDRLNLNDLYVRLNHLEESIITIIVGALGMVLSGEAVNVQHVRLQNLNNNRFVSMQKMHLITTWREIT